MLAKIKLIDEEKERYSSELSSILGYVDKLQKVKIPESSDACSAESRRAKSCVDTLDIESHLRNDEVIGVSSRMQDDLLSQAPEKDDRLIKAKAVFE